MRLRSIPPITSTGRDSQRLRLAVAMRVRTGQRYEKLEPLRPLACATCGGRNINGAEWGDGVWYVWCVACDSKEPAKEEVR